MDEDEQKRIKLGRSNFVWDEFGLHQYLFASILIKRIKRPGYIIHTVMLKDKAIFDLWYNTRIAYNLSRGLSKQADGTWIEVDYKLLFE